MVFSPMAKYLGYLRKLKPSLKGVWDLLSVIFFREYLNKSENFDIYQVLLKRYSFSEEYFSDLCLIHKVTVLLPKITSDSSEETFSMERDFFE